MTTKRGARGGRVRPGDPGRMPEGVDWTPYGGDVGPENRVIAIDGESRANINSLAFRIEEIVKEVSDLRARVMKLESKNALSDTGLTIELYCKQEGWSSAPHPDTVISSGGGMGTSTLVWSLEEGRYMVLDTYELDTKDFGIVRWVQIRCDLEDPTRTNDGFAYLPVKPELVDAEGLYNQLMDADEDVYPDDFTAFVWGRDGMRSFLARRIRGEKGSAKRVA